MSSAASAARSASAPYQKGDSAAVKPVLLPDALRAMQNSLDIDE